MRAELKGRATAGTRDVQVIAGDVALSGNLTIPGDAVGIVLFAHGSGSSRHSPRNVFVADQLQRGRIATLLIDLLTRAEEAIDIQTAELRFDIPLLARRVSQATDWLREQPETHELPVGYFGASTGAAAALVAAAARPREVAAVVSRGGRPDLAGDALPQVIAPTLLIVGDLDTEVIRLNEEAMEQMRCQRELVFVPGATHLFEEPGTLEEVARLATEWFAKHLARSLWRPSSS
jgi:pimeloyl-ACP methyl ester carboxylesterase